MKVCQQTCGPLHLLIPFSKQKAMYTFGAASWNIIWSIGAVDVLENKAS
jgi:hypothetical protein